MKFVADRMVEKLARWLRILGCDVVSDSSRSLEDLVRFANEEKRVFLTRRKKIPKSISPIAVFNVGSEEFDEQFRRIVLQFGLDVKKKIFTRCIDCNVKVAKIVNKESVKDKVPYHSWEGFNEFFECPSCKKVYWAGAHYINTMRKLKKILGAKFSDGK